MLNFSEAVDVSEVLSSLTDCPSCPSLFSANEERARGCHSNPEEAQWHGPQHRGCQGRTGHLKVCVFNLYKSIADFRVLYVPFF